MVPPTSKFTFRKLLFTTYLFSIVPIEIVAVDMEADISQLEAPTFTTISRGPPEPMLRLKWDHKVNLIGEKVLNPMIHCCDQCEKPILIYGRMIPCKHVFCLRCARSEPIKICPRCKEKVVRVEQSGLGTVFMCTHGGSRYGNTGCRRTYLSQRDLQAHINHRHVTAAAEPKLAEVKATVATQRKTIVVGERSPSRLAATRPNQSFAANIGTPNQTSPATTGRGSLIPIPIQELQHQSIQPITSGTGGTLHHHQQTVSVDLNAYFNQQQQQQSYGHGQVLNYNSVLSTTQSSQSQQFVQMGIQAGLSGSGAQAINVSTASQFYSPYGSYNSMQNNQSNTNYTNARSTYDQVGNNYQANNVSMQQSSQQQWQQQYYR